MMMMSSLWQERHHYHVGGRSVSRGDLHFGAMLGRRPVAADFSTTDEMGQILVDDLVSY